MTCGTNAGYVAHIRAKQPTCAPCRAAHSEYQRLYKSSAVQCRTCHEEIEAVLPHGVYGEWMHTSDKRERAADGHLAQPFTLPREEAS